MTTQFGDKYRAWARITKATMRIHHKPGDAMQVDWAGDTLSVYDSMTGEITPAYLFIAVLPCSCYIYAEATADMKLVQLNLREFRQREGCRRSAYLEEEKAFMKPLPAQRYELATWNPNIKVGTDYLVSDGRNKYSVPFDLIGEKVDIRLTSTTVEVFFHGSRVAAHIRKTSAQREPVVNENHMAPEHRKYLNYNTEDFTAWTRSVGENTEKTVTYFLTAGKEPEQGYKSCASLTKLCEKYGIKKLETACAEVLKHTSAPSLRLISTILKNGIINQEEKKPEVKENSNAYGITRGAAYYSKCGKDGEKK